MQKKTKQVHVIIIGFEIHISDTFSNKENSCGQAYVCVFLCVCMHAHTRMCARMCKIPYSVSSITAWSYVTPCWLNFTTIMYVTFGSIVPTTIACAYHYLQCEICAIEKVKQGMYIMIIVRCLVIIAALLQKLQPW